MMIRKFFECLMISIGAIMFVFGLTVTATDDEIWWTPPVIAIIGMGLMVVGFLLTKQRTETDAEQTSIAAVEYTDRYIILHCESDDYYIPISQSEFENVVGIIEVQKNDIH